MLTLGVRGSIRICVIVQVRRMTRAIKRILLVEDDPDQRTIIRATLETEGHQVDTAANGREALEAIEAATPDLLVLDVLMPQMNGVELTKTLKRDKLTATIPIIVLTAIDDRRHMKTALFDLGVDYYVPKPFTPDDLLDKVKQALQRPKFAE